MTLIVRARLAGLDESLEEASADLYASPAQTFRKITLPLMMPAVLAGALLAFSLSLDNTIISSFVSTADASPWPVYVFSSLRSVLRPSIAAMSTLVLLLTLVRPRARGDRAPQRRRIRRGGGRDDRRAWRPRPAN